MNHEAQTQVSMGRLANAFLTKVCGLSELAPPFKTALVLSKKIGESDEILLAESRFEWFTPPFHKPKW